MRIHPLTAGLRSLADDDLPSKFSRMQLAAAFERAYGQPCSHNRMVSMMKALRKTGTIELTHKAARANGEVDLYREARTRAVAQ